jgi:hypothetical protein
MNEPETTTPGPWHVEKACGRYEVWPQDHGQAHTSVATVPRKIDAALIAATPELFALVRAWLLTDPHGTHSDACRSAIAKAKGTP